MKKFDAVIEFENRDTIRIPDIWACEASEVSEQLLQADWDGIIKRVIVYER